MGMEQVMVFVGNGFDISVLNKYGEGVTTSYSTFYSFFKYRYGDNKENLLINQMEEARKNGEKNWSDFEGILTQDIKNTSPFEKEKIDRLVRNLAELQRAFSRFLNDVVNNDVIDMLASATSIKYDVAVPYKCKKTYPEQAFTRFLGDLSEEQYQKCGFHNRIDHHDQLKFIFINFNYTSLLDNYLYLDKAVFSPEPYTTSYNNVDFITNPNSYKGHLTIKDKANFLNASCKLLPVDIYHPHGFQDVPKSLLFGTESTICNKTGDGRRAFIKSFWARDEERYADKFAETSLFIIYGCSMGESDSWWWNKIYERLLDEKYAELIIYNYGREDNETVIRRFAKGCGKEILDTATYNKIAEHIFVINFENSGDIIFLRLPERDEVEEYIKNS